MNRRKLLGSVISLAVLSACSGSSKFKTYNGPEVTFVVVNKAARKMYLLHNNQVLKEYTIDLGFAPIGDKFYEGDGRTPEGLYYIDRRNPNSKYHLSLGISYPNDQDRAEAAALGKEPGGDIFIHGNSKPAQLGNNDWTWGCIALPDQEMETVYAMIKNGTPIKINP